MTVLLTGRLAAQEGSPAGPVPVERLTARRAALLDSIGTGVAIVRAGERRSLEGDYPQDSDYREDNTFFYLTGLEAPGGWLVLQARDGAPDSTILYLPGRDAAVEQWTGTTPGPGREASRLSGIEEVRPASRLAEDLPASITGAGSPAVSGALYLGMRSRQRDSPRLRDALRKTGSAGTAPRVEDLDRKVAGLRLVKDADEQGRLRRAIGITGQSLREAMAAIRPGMWEYEIEALVEYGFRRRGAERVGFPSIVGSGPNGATLHYDKNRRQTRPGDLIVVDVGAEFGYYSADVTRTVPVSGRFTARQRRLYDLVLGAQQAAIDSVRPGTDLLALNRIARAWLRENSAGLCGEAGCDRYFVHGLSHWLGMDVHDVGAIGTRLAPGMVFTIEPGIYLPREGLGIRIEDDILVTQTGHEVLSESAPRSAEEVERMMNPR